MDIIKKVSPILVTPTSSSVTIGISKRFFLFTMLQRIINIIEEDPHLNFVALLKSYKVLGRILYGTLHEFYRDRNKLYFKNFFVDRKLWELVKQDLEYLYPKYKDLKVTITKRGLVVYDNYKKNQFNVLMMTSHAGTWMPQEIKSKMNLSDSFRFREEDIDTHRIYGRVVLEKAGIWIDNKLSRFACDYNRPMKRAIYSNKSEATWNVRRLWKKKLAKPEIDEMHASYKDFYFTLARVVDTYRFNIIFDGHSMKNLEGRPEISFGIRYVPKFYLPIVKSMQKKLKGTGYASVRVNSPYGGGYILKWLSTKFPDVFIFSMEVNKGIYMTKDMNKTIANRLEKVSKDVAAIFDIEVEDFGTDKPGP